MSLASRLTERVRIEAPDATDDGYGGKTIAWNPLATVFAEVFALATVATTREPLVGEQPQAHAGYRVTLRVRTDVTAAMRLVWRNRTLQIHSLHERDDTLSILAYEEGI